MRALGDAAASWRAKVTTSSMNAAISLAVARSAVRGQQEDGAFVAEEDGRVERLI
jgi:hypothetical protein